MSENKKGIMELAEEFILYKHKLGYVYQTQALLLKRFVKYAMTAEPLSVYPEEGVTREYLENLSNSRGSLYNSAMVLREFSRYLIRRGYATAYIIPSKIMKLPIPDPPYFFSENECAAFFNALDAMEPMPGRKGREFILPALFRLLYCCGLRCKEVRVLLCKDVHLGEHFIDILQSKGPKSRRIFISEELALYLSEYDGKAALLFPKRTYFFQNTNGHYSSAAIINNFKRFWLKAFPDFVITNRPRAYDFRHHFAWSNLNKWASEGLDVNAMIPYLMRYMGHQSVKGTLYYFHFVPEFFPEFSEMSKSFEDVLPEVPDEE